MKVKPVQVRARPAPVVKRGLGERWSDDTPLHRRLLSCCYTARHFICCIYLSSLSRGPDLSQRRLLRVCWFGGGGVLLPGRLPTPTLPHSQGNIDVMFVRNTKYHFPNFILKHFFKYKTYENSLPFIAPNKESNH